MTPHSYPAPAKLNLFLHVLGRRTDGYHLLQTVFRFIDFCDELSFGVRDDGEIRRSVDIPGIAPQDDLCLRAARLLKEYSGSPLGAEITLRKKLPLGGGLGGGSSDAATTLIALNHLWKLGVARTALQALALELGADVPVFVFGKNAFAEGIGEILQPIDLAPRWYLVLTPQVQVSTAEIFADPHLTRASNPIKIAAFFEGRGHNDLAPVVCRNYPLVAHYLAWLEQFGPARVTGSGACVFAEFDTEKEARRVLARMPADMTGIVARGLNEHPLYRLNAE